MLNYSWDAVVLSMHSRGYEVSIFSDLSWFQETPFSDSFLVDVHGNQLKQ